MEFIQQKKQCAYPSHSSSSLISARAHDPNNSKPSMPLVQWPPYHDAALFLSRLSRLLVLQVKEFYRAGAVIRAFAENSDFQLEVLSNTRWAYSDTKFQVLWISEFSSGKKRRKEPYEKV